MHNPHALHIVSSIEIVPSAFFVNDVDNATRDLNDFRQIDFDGDGSISEEELRELSQRNVDVSTSNKIMELFSTHPDSLKRVKRLSELEN